MAGGRPYRPELTPPKVAPPVPVYTGDTPKTCANCQHFEPNKKRPRFGVCHNGISGKGVDLGFATRAIDGCAYGFYPHVERFPLKAGPGGAR